MKRRVEDIIKEQESEESEEQDDDDEENGVSNAEESDEEVALDGEENEDDEDSEDDEDFASLSDGSENEENDNDDDDAEGGEGAIDNELNPYEILGVSTTASDKEIKKQYYKLSLQYHPDKNGDKDKFQEISYAYSILSDKDKRARYDNGATITDLLDGMYEKLDKRSLDDFKKSYQNSKEEEQAVLDAYTSFKGDLTRIFQHVLCAHPIDDYDRCIKIINNAITDQRVERFKAFEQEPQKKAKRDKKAKKEEKEAEDLAKELGIGEVNGEEGLAALIRQRGRERMQSMITGIEARYGKKQKTR